jgi:Protein of unknown function (DUF1488)
MTIEFPNLSRGYDGTRHCIRFSGYDGVLERLFFVEEEAIRTLDPSAASGESKLLDAFDRHRDCICEVAVRVYGGQRLGSYTLTARDFSWPSR